MRMATIARGVLILLTVGGVLGVGSVPGTARTTWGARVVLAGPVWQFPMPVTGLGYAGPHSLWVFLSRKAVQPPTVLFEVNTQHHILERRFTLGASVRTFGTASDGTAVVAEGNRLQEWWRQAHQVFSVPRGTTVIGVAPVSHEAVWLALRGANQRVEVGRYLLPEGRLGDVHRLAGMAQETVVGMVPASRGAWIVTGPRPVAYWVPAAGLPGSYARAVVPPSAQTLAAVGVNSRGQGWISGTTGDGRPAVWPIAGPANVGHPYSLPTVVNMVSQGLVVAPNGVGYFGFSALGGTSGYPGVVGVTRQGAAAASVWTQLAIPGGGVGPLLLTPTGQLWGGIPFSRLLLPLQT